MSEKDDRKNARRKQGLRCHLLRDLPDVELEELLICLGLLTESARDDRAAVTAALQELVLGLIHRATTGGNAEFYKGLRFENQFSRSE